MTTNTLLWIGIVLSLLTFIATLVLGILILKLLYKIVKMIVTAPVKMVKGISSGIKNSKSKKSNK